MALAFLSAAAPGVAPVVAPGNLRASQAQIGTAPASTDDFASCAGASFLTAIGAAVAVRSAVRCRAAKKKAPAENLFYGKEIEQGVIPRPEDLLESPKFPAYIGSISGYFSKSTRERHAITWTAKEEYYFEMPTTGWAIMNKGENLCYFRKKEQCIALSKQLRKVKIDNFKIYRLKKDGSVVFMHPADGVFPEKVNKGRVQVNGRPFSIGSNPQPGMLTDTIYNQKSYEADALTTWFVKAREMAMQDKENIFPVPSPNQLGASIEVDGSMPGDKELMKFMSGDKDAADRMKKQADLRANASGPVVKRGSTGHPSAGFGSL